MVFSVTSSIFYKKIRERCTAIKKNGDFLDEYIIDTQIWMEDMIPQEHYMYLLSSESFSRKSRAFRHCLLIVVGSCTIDETPDENKCDLIVCPTLTDVSQLANIVFSILDQFRHWRNVWNDVLLTTENASDILNANRDLLNMEFFLYDRNYDSLAVSEGFFGHYKDRQPDLLRWVLTDLRNDEEGILKEHYQDRDLYMYDLAWPEGQTQVCLAFNIFFHNEHAATLLARRRTGEIETGDRQFLAWTGAAIADYYVGYYTRLHHTGAENRLVQLLATFIRNETVIQTDAADVLYSCGWQVWDTYQAAKLSFLEEGSVGFSREYCCSQIEKAMKYCIAFPMQDTTYCVWNLTLYADESPENVLPVFLRDNLCHAGISRPVKGIYSLHAAFSQAGYALMVGQKTQPHFWYFRFEDYTLQYLAMQATREFEAEYIIHPSLALLKEHDKTKNTDYYHTLQCYLKNNMNASKTSEELFIHRSTLMQRIAQIEKTGRLDLKNLRERTYLLLSWMLLGEI